MAYGELTSNFSQILTNLSFSSQVLAKWMCVDDVGWRVASFMTSDISKIGLWSREGRFYSTLPFVASDVGRKLRFSPNRRTMRGLRTWTGVRVGGL